MSNLTEIFQDTEFKKMITDSNEVRELFNLNNLPKKLLTTRIQKLYYIGERVNPQLKKSYYIAYGQLKKSEAKIIEGSIYSRIYMTSFNCKLSYENQIEILRKDGFTVNIR